MRGIYIGSHCAFSEKVCVYRSGEGLREAASVGEEQRMEKGDVQDTEGLIGRYGTGNGPNHVNKLISRKPIN